MLGLRGWCCARIEGVGVYGGMLVGRRRCGRMGELGGRLEWFGRGIEIVVLSDSRSLWVVVTLCLSKLLNDVLRQMD